LLLPSPSTATSPVPNAALMQCDAGISPVSTLRARSLRPSAA
jgi:hypothetical protein